MNTHKQQVLFLSKVKLLLKKCNKKNFLPKSNSVFYLSTYTQSFGSLIVDRLLNRSKVSTILTIILKEFFSSSSRQFKSITQKSKKTYTKIIISWAKEKDFSINGSYTDSYLNTNSRKDKNLLWFLIYTDKNIPKKIDSNICLFQTINKGFNFFNIIKLITSNLLFLFKDTNYFLSQISTHNNLSIHLSNAFKKFLNKDLKEILINYEGQPFQNEIIRITKKFNKKVKIIGNVHAPLMSIPTNFFYKNFSPDKIIVNGPDIKFLFVKYLGWNSKKIKIKKSLRILNIKKDMSNTVFLPNNINSPKLLMNSFNLLMNDSDYNLNDFKIKLHPQQLNLKSHQIVAQNLQKLLQIKKKMGNFKKEKNLSVFIGATGSIIEALERNVEVIHICEDVILEPYLSELYPNIISEKIHNNIFRYKLKKKRTLLILGDKSNNLFNYFSKY